MLVIAVFLGFSAAASDMTQLSVFRLLAGIGMGSMLPVLTITVGEFAPTRRRSAAISVLSTGLALGGVIGGAGAAALMSATSWRSAFLFGAVITAAACILVIVSMPETPDYLAARNTASAQAKLESLLVRMGIDPSDSERTFSVADRIGAPSSPGTPAGIAIRSWRMVAVLFTFALAITAYYFGSMWLPKLLVLAGMSTNQGISGVLLLTLGSAAAGLVVAVLSIRFSPFAVTVAFGIASAGLLGVFALVSDDLTWALIVAPLLGLCQYAAAIGVYTLIPVLFSTENRSSAMGLGVGIGRLGMITMPMVIGLLIDRSWHPESLFLLMIIPTVMAAALVYYLGRDHDAIRPEPHGTRGSGKPDTVDFAV
ncbi:hypothetical protein NJ76_23225 [Rhodococcus sp. IITR03]|nr:hypothetical protein NJ76_23225 [Rhodococcus sp. IITR03]